MKWDDPDFVFSRGRGCPACHGTGFKGRIGIYEILRLTPAVREVINVKGSELDIRKAALSSGFVTLVEDAREKLRSGLTTPEELLRVIQLSDEVAIPCPRCGRPVSSEAGKCLYCAESARLSCTVCGQEVPQDWSVCPRCTTPVVPQPLQPKASLIAPASDMGLGLNAFRQLRGKNGLDPVQ